MRSLRVLLNIITSPGVVVHEFAHKQMCDFFYVPVQEVVYFQFDDPAGYVEHSIPRSYLASMLIAIAPFLVNTIIAFTISTIITYVFFSNTPVVDVVMSFPDIVYVVFGFWLSVSFGAHSFPSSTDGEAVWNQSKRQWYNPLLLIGIPLFGVIKLVNVVSNAYTRLIVGVLVTLVGVYAGLNPFVFRVLFELVF